MSSARRAGDECDAVFCWVSCGKCSARLSLGNSFNKLIIGKGPFAGLSCAQSTASCLKVRRVDLILAQKPRCPTPWRHHSGEIARSKGIAMVECCKMPGQLIRTLLVRILFSGTSRFLCQNQLTRWNFFGTTAFHGWRADLQHAWLAVSQLIDLRISSLLVGRRGIASYLPR